MGPARRLGVSYVALGMKEMRNPFRPRDARVPRGTYAWPFWGGMWKGKAQSQYCQRLKDPFLLDYHCWVPQVTGPSSGLLTSSLGGILQICRPKLFPLSLIHI